jgi:hypothetical protein
MRLSLNGEPTTGRRLKAFFYCASMLIGLPPLAMHLNRWQGRKDT